MKVTSEEAAGALNRERTQPLERLDSYQYINRAYAYGRGSETGASTGVRARIRSFFARILRSILRDYFDEEVRYQSALVQTVNAVAKRSDEAYLREIRDELHASVFALQNELGKRVEGEARKLHAELGSVSQRNAEHQAVLSELRSVVTGLERLFAVESRRVSTSSDSKPIDYSYVLLENRFRGGEEEVSARLAQYVEVFAGAENPVLEIGSGRGELLRLFKRSGIEAYGVEMDVGMQTLASDEGLCVKLENGIEHLESCRDSTLGGVIAVQVIEHLSLEQLKKLLQEAKRTLAPGAKLVLETINSESLLALGHNYFRDPTHTFPLHPDTMRFLLEMLSFKIIEIRKLSPFPAEATFQPIALEPWHPSSLRNLIEQVNANFVRLNGLLFGYQDYCLIATPADNP